MNDSDPNNPQSHFPRMPFCPLAILMPFEENPYIVPHLKALISSKKILGGQRCGSILSL